MGVEKGLAEVMTIIELMEMTNGSVRLVQPCVVSGSQRALAGGAGQPAGPRVSTSAARALPALSDLLVFEV